jgi:hypothetical protein
MHFPPPATLLPYTISTLRFIEAWSTRTLRIAMRLYGDHKSPDRVPRKSGHAGQFLCRQTSRFSCNCLDSTYLGRGEIGGRNSSNKMRSVHPGYRRGGVFQLTSATGLAASLGCVFQSIIRLHVGGNATGSSDMPWRVRSASRPRASWSRHQKLV